MKLKFIAIAAAIGMVTASLPAQDLLVRGGRVITMTGKDLPKGRVLIKGGRIKRVSKRASAKGVPIVDATGKVIMPGFVLAYTDERGTGASTENVPLVPYVTVGDSIDPSLPYFENSLRDGHLTLCVMAGSRTVIGGMGMILRPYGLRVEDMTQVRDAGMKISLIPSNGNRASQLATLRKALDDGKRLLANKLLVETDAELTGNWDLDLETLQIARQSRALIRLLKKDIPAFIECGTAGDVVRALQLIKEYDLDARLVCHSATWRAAKWLARSKMPIILKGAFELEDTDPETGKRVTRNVPKIFHEAGVRFAVISQSRLLGQRYLWYQAATLVRLGLPRDVALASVTTTAAEILGLGDRKGSLAKGKDGDLLVLTADPLSGRAWVDTAVIAGKVVYRRREDPRLAEVFETGTR